MRTFAQLFILWLAGALLAISAAQAPASAPTVVQPREESAPSGYLVARQSTIPAAQVSRTRPIPTLIRDIRIGIKKQFIRVVLDLQRQVSFTQTRRSDPHRVLIDLKNSLLTPAAKAKLRAKDFPHGVDVAQLRSGAVRVSVDLTAVGRYELLPLSNPPRLVLDLYDVRSASSRGTGLNGAAGLNGEARSQEQPRAVRPSINLIVIDPGHGGKDPGAVGRRGTREKDVTLPVSLYLRDLIEKRLGKKVLMTRDRDVFVDLEERANFANKHGADLFVSIHVNAHPRRSVKGIEVYHFGEPSDPRAMEVAARENGLELDPTHIPEFIVADLVTTKMVELSQDLAWTTRASMVRRLNGRYKMVDHGVKTAPFYVLRFTTMASILAEIGYVSNPREEQYLRTKAFQRHIAEAIFDGIRAYIDNHR